MNSDIFISFSKTLNVLSCIISDTSGSIKKFFWNKEVLKYDEKLVMFYIYLPNDPWNTNFCLNTGLPNNTNKYLWVTHPFRITIISNLQWRWSPKTYRVLFDSSCLLLTIEETKGPQNHYQHFLSFCKIYVGKISIFQKLIAFSNGKNFQRFRSKKPLQIFFG